MTVWEWVTLVYCLIVMVTLAICFHVRREIRCLRAENRMLRAQRDCLKSAFKAVATDWAELHGGDSIQLIIERMPDSEFAQLLERCQLAAREHKEG